MELPLKFLAPLVAAGLAGCETRSPDPQPGPPVPTAPLVDGVREVVEAGLVRVREAPEDVGAWLELAMTFEANGLTENAVTSYERAVELDGSSAQAWHHLARALSRTADLEAALAAADRACALAPAYAPASWRRGEWLLESGRLDEAAAAFVRAREIDPTDPAGAWGLARVALQRGRGEEALALLTAPSDLEELPPYTHHLRAAAHRLTGNEPAAELAQSLAGPPTWRDPWAAEVPRRRAGIHRSLRAARAAAAAGNYAEAAQRLERLRADDPRDVNVAGMLAGVYLAQDRSAAAMALLLSTRDRVGGHYRVAFNLANAHEHAGDDELAIEEFAECLRLHPSFGLAHFRMGRLLARARRNEEALVSLDEAERLGQASAELDGLRATTLLRLGRAREALELLRTSCREHPQAVALAFTHAEALLAHGTLDEAKAALRAVETLAGGDERAADLMRRLTARSVAERDEE